VSKVLNGRTDVAADTRDRVGQMLRSNGYRVASGLPFGVADLLIGSLHGPWAEELIRARSRPRARLTRASSVTTVESDADFGHWLDRAAEA